MTTGWSHRGGKRHRTAYLLCGNWHRAEDLVQTTFAKVYAARSRMQEGRAIGYLRRTLTHTYIDDSRRRWQGESPTEELPDQPAPSEYPYEDRMVLLVALARLPPRQRACIVLRFYDDCTVEETAAALGCETGTVKSNTARGLEALRNLLTDSDLRPFTLVRKDI